MNYSITKRERLPGSKTWKVWYERWESCRCNKEDLEIEIESERMPRLTDIVKQEKALQN